MIREAKESDLEEIFNLIYSSFDQKEEVNLVKELISDKDILINLVLEKSETIIGNVIVSKITLRPDSGLFCGGIAPLSVAPEHQSYGIGSQLMKNIIIESKKAGLDALFLLGDPNYYKKFGFTVSKLKSDYNIDHFQELELTDGCLVNVILKFYMRRHF